MAHGVLLLLKSEERSSALIHGGEFQIFSSAENADATPFDI